MQEVTKVAPHEGEHRKRWFYEPEMHLLVWFDEDDEIYGFQLCYDAVKNPHALTWFKHSGYHHNRVDDGDDCGGYKMTPILIRDGHFDNVGIAEIFLEKSKNIPENISEFVYKKLIKYSMNSD